MTTRQTPKVRQALGWADVRGRGLGMWSFALNRVTGIGLVAYLYLHLAVLSMLTRGPAAWDGFVQIVRSPLFLVLDVILIAGWIVHALNGLRLSLNGLGLLTRARQTLVLFVAFMLLALVGIAVLALMVFEAVG